jgi:L-malate glycosyltransferase
MAQRWPILLMVRELGIGGCERDVAKMALHLDRNRFEPHVGCFISEGFRGRELRDAGIPILRLPVRSFKSYSAVRAMFTMRRYVREHGIRLVHAFDIPTDLFGIPAARFSGVPAVIASQLSYRSMYPRMDQWLMAGIDRMADRIVVNSYAVGDELIAKNVPAAKIHVSHNGVEASEFYPRQVSRPEALAGASLVIGTVCVLRQEKRLDLLIRAFARVRSLDAAMKLLVVGSGVELPRMETLADELRIRQACCFIPATADVVPWMRSIDVFVLSSEHESFPNALLEAMACGCAPVASSVGGVPELIAAGRNGLLFKAGDLDGLTRMLELVVQDVEIRRTLARNAAVTARDEFSIERNVRRAEALYESLLTGRTMAVASVDAEMNPR